MFDISRVGSDRSGQAVFISHGSDPGKALVLKPLLERRHRDVKNDTRRLEQTPWEERAAVSSSITNSLTVLARVFDTARFGIAVRKHRLLPR